MKVALCCIARLENKYIKEWVDYYLNLSIDTIFIYDNNFNHEETFDDVLKEEIKNKQVKIINWRNKTNCQKQAYQDCYIKNHNNFDWMCFFDCDEFLTFVNPDENIKSFLEKYNDWDSIHINWMNYGDNGLTKYENIPVLERFISPILPLDFRYTYTFPENNHIKSIVKCKFNQIFFKNSHCLKSPKMSCCTPEKIPIDYNSSFQEFNYSTAYLRHFSTKTFEEFCNIKARRGFPDGSGNNYFNNKNLKEDFEKRNGR